MPLNKKKFLQNKFPGFTEFFSYHIDKKKNENMLLYNEKKFFSLSYYNTYRIKKC